MLSRSTYSQDHIDACRALVAEQVRGYRALAAAAAPQAAAQLAAFEPGFANGLVLVLDQCFVHRARGKEGKDGNPMNEVRVLCSSLVEHGGVVTLESGIRLKPDTSVLGLGEGDRIALGVDDAERLADAYFAAIEGAFAG